MTLTELKVWMKAYRQYELTDNEFIDKVEDYTKALIDAKPIVSGSLQDFMDDVEYMMGLYSKQRYTQAEAQRDKLAEKLDDIMRLGGTDR